MRLAFAAAAFAVLLAAAPARSDTQHQLTKKRVVMHYRMLEKMIRRFSLEAGSPRPRG
jgi:hypothetical protein